jgi:hypothetical protein
MILNNELKKMGNEVVVAYLKVLSQHLHGWTEENQEEPQSG